MFAGSSPVLITTSISSPFLLSSIDSIGIRTLLFYSLIVMPILGSVFWSIYSKKKTTHRNGSSSNSIIQPVIVDSNQSSAEIAKSYSLNQGIFHLSYWFCCCCLIRFVTIYFDLRSWLISAALGFWMIFGNFCIIKNL